MLGHVYNMDPLDKAMINIPSGTLQYLVMLLRMAHSGHSAIWRAFTSNTGF